MIKYLSQMYTCLELFEGCLPDSSDEHELRPSTHKEIQWMLARPSF